MIAGAYLLRYSKDAEADRAFFRDVPQFRAIDAGEGWLIFAPPPAELAVRPGDGDCVQGHAEIRLLGAVLYLVCDDLRSVIRSLEAKKVTCTPVAEAEWGIKTTIRLPSRGDIGLYQPRHPTAVG
jgi:hypothetical protein